MQGAMTGNVGGLWGGRLRVFDSLPSTNQWMLEHAAEIRHGDVVRAVQQTAGRGRFNRRWLTPGQRELTLSVGMLESRCQPAVAGFLGAATALAARATGEALGLPAKVKWPNDVLVHGRKLAGVLVERDLRHGVYVVGIGVNLNLQASDFEAMTPLQPATSVAMETGLVVDPELALALLVRNLAMFLAMAAEGHFQALRTAWAGQDHLMGQRVRVAGPDGELEGDYAGITADGAMRLKGADGQERVLLSGDTSLVKGSD